jgi:hypothetical protein
VRPDMTTPFFRAGPGPPISPLIVVRWNGKERLFSGQLVGVRRRGLLAPDVQVVNDM